MHRAQPDSSGWVAASSARPRRAQLVNVQSNSEFASHQLNRDTWRDETLVSIVEGSFVFLQVRVPARPPAGAPLAYRTRTGPLCFCCDQLADVWDVL